MKIDKDKLYVSKHNIQYIKHYIEFIMKEAKCKGATACEVSVLLEHGLYVNVRQGELETIKFNNEQNVYITLYSGQRKGVASTSIIEKQSICETIDAALSISKYTSEDKYSGLADSNLMAQNVLELDLYHPWNIKIDKAIEIVLTCEKIALNNDTRIKKGDGTTLITNNYCTVYGNSNNFLAGYISTLHSISCVVIAEDNGEMQSGYCYDINRCSDNLTNIEIIGNNAAKRAISRLGSRKIKTEKVPVLFNAEVAVGLFSNFIKAILGKNLYSKSSFLEGSLYKTVFSSNITIDERPHLLGAIGSASFDSDGLATYSKTFVQNGQLLSYALGTYSGRKLGMHSTANADGVNNLFISHGNYDKNNLFKRMKRGLFVTELMGQGVNLVTGDYSRGASGYWIDNCEIKYPVENIVISTNLNDLFKNIDSIGTDIEKRGNIYCGSVLVESMMIAGN